MRILFIGCVEFSARALQTLIAAKVEVAGVVTRRQSVFNADFADLQPLCAAAGLAIHFTSDVNSGETLDWIGSRRPDIVFCFGWSSLIKRELLAMPAMGVIGFHPAALPRNRGRHPLIWALALGLEETASTFFFMDEGADSGDLLDQRPVPIHYEDTARTLYDRVAATALAQITAFLPKLQAGTFSRTPQDHRLANTWRKRGKNDGLIDFRMSSRGVYNLVRALTHPYIGAHALYRDQEVKVWAAREERTAAANIEAGKVVAVEENALLVKCGEGAVWLLRHEFTPMPAAGEYLG